MSESVQGSNCSFIFKKRNIKNKSTRKREHSNSEGNKFI